MLNERAALAGRLARIDRGLVPLRQQHSDAQAQADALAAQVAAIERTRQEVVEVVRAIDVVLQTRFPTVNPAAAGRVSAWAGKYGKRGSFKAFLLTTIERASPAPVTTVELLAAAVSHFALNVTSAQRRDFSRNLKIALRTEPTRVEELPSTGTRGATGWRWRTPGTLEDVARRVEGHERTHALWPEVGGQRAGGHRG